MSDQPEPRPEPRAPKPDASPSSAGRGPDGLRGEAYIPRPDAPRRRRGLWLAAALLLAGAGGYAAHRHYSGAAPATAAMAVQEGVLVVGAADLDVAATERVRKAEDKEADAVVPAAAPKVQESPRPIALPGMTPQARHAVRADGWEVFRMEMLDTVYDDGDAVLLSVDGVPMCYVTISNAGARFELPLKRGANHKITITGVEDGGDIVTLGVRTSLGDMISSPLMKGQSETWRIDFR